MNAVVEDKQDSLPPPVPEKDWSFLDSLPIDFGQVSDTLIKIAVEQLKSDSVLPAALIAKLQSGIKIWEYNQLSFHDFDKDGKEELLWVTANVPMGCDCYNSGTFYVLKKANGVDWKVIFEENNHKFVPEVRVIDNDYIRRYGVYGDYIYKLMGDSLYQVIKFPNFNYTGRGFSSPEIVITSTLQKLHKDTLIVLYEYSIYPSYPSIEKNIIMIRNDSKEDQDMLEYFVSEASPIPDLITKTERVEFRLNTHQKKFIPTKHTETTLFLDSVPIFSSQFFLKIFKKDLDKLAKDGSPEQKTALKFLRQKKELREENLKNGDKMTTYLVDGKIIFQNLVRDRKVLWYKQFNHKTKQYDFTQN